MKKSPIQPPSSLLKTREVKVWQTGYLQVSQVVQQLLVYPLGLETPTKQLSFWVNQSVHESRTIKKTWTKISAFLYYKWKLTGFPGAPLFPLFPDGAPPPFINTNNYITGLLKGLHPFYLYFCRSTVNLGSLNSLKAWKTRKTSRSRMALIPWSTTWAQLPHRSLKIHSKKWKSERLSLLTTGIIEHNCETLPRSLQAHALLLHPVDLYDPGNHTPFHTNTRQSGCGFTCVHSYLSEMNPTMSPFSPGRPIIPLSPCLPWAAGRHSRGIIAATSPHNQWRQNTLLE